METREDLSNIGVIALDGRSIINVGWDSLNPYVELEKDGLVQGAAEGKKVLTNSHVQYVIRDNYKWVVTLSRPILGERRQDRRRFLYRLKLQNIKRPV